MRLAVTPLTHAAGPGHVNGVIRKGPNGGEAISQPAAGWLDKQAASVADLFHQRFTLAFQRSDAVTHFMAKILEILLLIVPFSLYRLL